jgi:hypothetical protein
LQSLFATVHAKPPRNELVDFVPSTPSSASIDAASSRSRDALDLHYHFFGGGKVCARKPKKRVTRNGTVAEVDRDGVGGLNTSSGGKSARNQTSGNVVVGGGRKRSPEMNEGGGEQSLASLSSSANVPQPQVRARDSESSSQEEEDSTEDSERKVFGAGGGEKNSNNRRRKNDSSLSTTATSPRHVSESAAMDAAPQPASPTPPRSHSVEAAMENDKAQKRYDSVGFVCLFWLDLILVLVLVFGFGLGLGFVFGLF